MKQAATHPLAPKSDAILIDPAFHQLRRIAQAEIYSGEEAKSTPAGVCAGVAIHPIWRALVGLIIYLGLVSSITLLYVFPNGRFIPGWTRLLAILWAILTFLAVFAPQSRLSLPTWPLGLQILALLVWAGVGGFAQIFRYWNVSGPVQRQQTKWALVGLSATVVGPAIVLLGVGSGGGGPEVPNILYQRVGASFFTFSFMFRTLSLSLFRLATVVFPLSFAIAILRYRLWDIDVIINRTMVYGSLTGALLVVYGFSVLILSNLFQAFTGQGQFAVVVSTLGIAALFNPLRRRIQATIDRQFYRRKYDAEKALAAFGHSLREELDMDSLTDAMLDVIEETMEPTYISCWLRRTNR